MNLSYVSRSVGKLPTDAQISDACLFLQRSRSRGKPGCPFHAKEKEAAVSSELLVRALL